MVMKRWDASLGWNTIISSLDKYTNLLELVPALVPFGMFHLSCSLTMGLVGLQILAWIYYPTAINTMRPFRFLNPRLRIN